MAAALALATRVVVAGVLLISAFGKFTDHRDASTRRRSGLPIAGLEVVLALLLLAGGWAWTLFVAATFFSAATIFQANRYRKGGARRSSGCGCFGAVEEHVSTAATLAILRVALLCFLCVVAGLSALSADGSAAPPEWIILAVVQGLVVTLLFPEIRLLARVAFSHLIIGPGCRFARETEASCLARVKRSTLWGTYSAYFDENQLEGWREECWQFFGAPTDAGGIAATIVFASSVRAIDGELRLAVVADDDEQILVSKREPYWSEDGRRESHHERVPVLL